MNNSIIDFFRHNQMSREYVEDGGFSDPGGWTIENPLSGNFNLTFSAARWIFSTGASNYCQRGLAINIPYDTGIYRCTFDSDIISGTGEFTSFITLRNAADTQTLFTSANMFFNIYPGGGPISFDIDSSTFANGENAAIIRLTGTYVSGNVVLQIDNVSIKKV